MKTVTTSKVEPAQFSSSWIYIHDSMNSGLSYTDVQIEDLKNSSENMLLINAWTLL